jgi:hypothetical protein
MNKIRGAYQITGGIEETLRDVEGEPRLTRVSGTMRFEGPIVGDGAVEWVMLYALDRSSRFTGYQRFEGSIGGQKGAVFMESTGFYDGRQSVGSWRIIPGSGTGGLTGIAGHGTFEAPGGEFVSYELEYELGARRPGGTDEADR